MQGIAVSSYQGGHVEYFTYLLDRLREVGRDDVKVYGGGGGVIVPAEIEELHRCAVVARIFSPQDGQQMGLAGMINSMIAACDVPPDRDGAVDLDALFDRRRPCPGADDQRDRERAGVVGSAGPDEVRSRGIASGALCWASPGRVAPASPRSPTSCCAASGSTRQDKLRIAVLAVDPTRRTRWGSAARRPDPHEHARQRPGVLPLAGHPVHGWRRRSDGALGPRRRDRRRQGVGCRPGRRRDTGDRAGRRGRSCRSSTCRST